MSTIQWVINSNLGIIKSGTNCDIPVTVYDPEPYLGPVTYQFIPGNTEDTTLPSSLNFDVNLGYIWGYLDYKPYYSKTYNLTVKATKTYTTSSQQTTITNTFSLLVKGTIPSSITWISDSNLGNLTTGYTSELSIVAKETNSSNRLRYNLSSGILPNGIMLSNDGLLIGAATTGSVGTYTFTVSASSIYESSDIYKDFTLTVIPSDREYTNMYFKPLMSLDKRRTYQDFISRTDIFDTASLYRYFDPKFGLQHDLKMVLEFGIERANLDDYTQGIVKNFYKRSFFFGDIKTAVAKDSNGNVVYEVVYVDIVDNIKGVKATIYSNNQEYHPASIDNMRRELSLITLADGIAIKINDDLLPRFMQTPQIGSSNPSGYMQLIPLCYALPGKSAGIVQKIKNSEFDFKLLHFEVDRLTVESSLNNTSAKYLILGRQNITAPLNADNVLFQGDVIWTFDDGIILTRN